MGPLLSSQAATTGIEMMMFGGIVAALSSIWTRRYERTLPAHSLRQHLDRFMAGTAWRVDAHLRVTATSGDDRGPFGRHLHELVGAPISQLLDEQYQEHFQEQHERALGGLSCEFDAKYFERYFHIVLEPLRDGSGFVTGVQGIAVDKTETHALREQLDHERHVDDLTGLATRTRFYDRLSQALHITARSGKKIAILAIDIDRFKLVNEGNGHAAGDSLLRATADRLRTLLRKADTVARLGADDFAAILVDVDTADKAAVVATKVARAFEMPFFIEGVQLHVTVSIGISLSPHDGHSPDMLLGNAETALSFAKINGGNTFHFYAIEMHHQIADRVALEAALRTALSDDELEVYYQPIVNREGRIASLEALVRWRHPVLGFLAPDRFIPLAEETGLIVQLGELVLRHACNDFIKMTEIYDGPLKMAVNLSPRQFDDEELLTTITRVIDASGIDPNCLELELTESTLMRNMDAAIELLERIKASGVSISIDDFGTGYSSLAYLKRLPIDTLKIDRSFVIELPDDGHASAIISAVTDLAHALRLEVIAEGVEEPEQLRCLLEIGCDRLQGYLFSRPVSLGSLLPMLRDPQMFTSVIAPVQQTS